MNRPSYTIELALDERFAKDLAAGGVFVPARGFNVLDEIDLVVRGIAGEVCVHARVVYIDPATGCGLELVGFGPEMKEQLARIASTPAEIAAVAGTKQRRKRVLTHSSKRKTRDSIEVVALDAKNSIDLDGDGDDNDLDGDDLDGDELDDDLDDDGDDDLDDDLGDATSIVANGDDADADAVDGDRADRADRAAADRATADRARRAAADRAAADRAADGDGIDDGTDRADGDGADGDGADSDASDGGGHSENDGHGDSDHGAVVRTKSGRIALNSQERLRGLTLAEQIKVARGPSSSERMALERMYGKNVWDALLHNPGLTTPEVARLARLGTLPRVLLEIIVNNNTWLQIPEVRRALLANPRLGTDQVTRVLRLLPKHELKLAATIPAYPHSVRSVAKRMVDQDKA